MGTGVCKGFRIVHNFNCLAVAHGDTYTVIGNQGRFDNLLGAVGVDNNGYGGNGGIADGNFYPYRAGTPGGHGDRGCGAGVPDHGNLRHGDCHSRTGSVGYGGGGNCRPYLGLAGRADLSGGLRAAGVLHGGSPGAILFGLHHSFGAVPVSRGLCHRTSASVFGFGGGASIRVSGGRSTGVGTAGRRASAGRRTSAGRTVSPSGISGRSGNGDSNGKIARAVSLGLSRIDIHMSCTGADAGNRYNIAAHRYRRNAVLRYRCGRRIAENVRINRSIGLDDNSGVASNEYRDSIPAYRGGLLCGVTRVVC